MLEEADGQTMEGIEIEGKQNPVPLQLMGNNDVVRGLESVPLQAIESDGEVGVKRRSIPPPGDGQKIYKIDPLLKGFRAHLDFR